MNLQSEKVRVRIAIALMSFIVISGIGIFMFLKESNECQANPLVYGAQRAYDSDMEIFCTCIPSNIKYPTFYFDKEAITFPKKNNYLGMP